MSTLLLGAITGAVLSGYLDDRISRKWTKVFSGCIYVLGALGCAFSVNVPMLVGFRFLLGLSVGTASLVAPMYISEVAPPVRSTSSRSPPGSCWPRGELPVRRCARRLAVDAGPRCAANSYTAPLGVEHRNPATGAANATVISRRMKQTASSLMTVVFDQFLRALR
ncbi:MFS transporter [Pseudonocardia adelaidensis]|uniref:Major facilitator superfamily (MFS) profile domain-containing protein n=1 Tax=Pseudonocardia adelaidensis TaxID=648754 RepID=A0ABP9NPM4_9PSEU